MATFPELLSPEDAVLLNEAQERRDPEVPTDSRQQSRHRRFHGRFSRGDVVFYSIAAALILVASVAFAIVWFMG